MSHPDGPPDLFLDRSLGRKKVPEGLRLITLAEHFGIPHDEPSRTWSGFSFAVSGVVRRHEGTTAFATLEPSGVRWSSPGCELLSSPTPTCPLSRWWNESSVHLPTSPRSAENAKGHSSSLFSRTASTSGLRGMFLILFSYVHIRMTHSRLLRQLEASETRERQDHRAENLVNAEGWIGHSSGHGCDDFQHADGASRPELGRQFVSKTTPATLIGAWPPTC